MCVANGGKSHADVLLNTDMIILFLGKVRIIVPRKVIEFICFRVLKFIYIRMRGCCSIPK